MLVLQRLPDESILIGDDIRVKVIKIRGDRVSLGVSAPKEVSIHREEVYEAVKREKSEAKD